MASDLSGLGDLVITIGADLSALQAALNEIPAIAQQATSEIAASFESIPTATEGVQQTFDNLNQSLTEVGTQATATGNQLSLLTDDVQALGASGQGELFGEWSNGLQEVGGEAKTVVDEVKNIPPVVHEANDSFSEFIKTAAEIAGVTLAIETLREAIIGSLEAFAEFQRVGESLTFIAGSASAAADAMERIPALADELGVSITSLETAMQKFAFFGADLDQIPGVLTAIADASRAAHLEFDSVAAAFERMDNTGKLAVRSLQAAGLQMADIAAAMGMVGASDKEVIQAFKDLGDGAEGAAARVQVLTDATARMAGIAHATANDLEGTWQQIKNATHEAAVNIGDSLALMIGPTGLDIVKLAIKGVETFIVSLIGWVTQAIDILKGFYNISLDVMRGIARAAQDAAHGNFDAAVQDLKDMGQTIASDFKSVVQTMQDDWTANGKIIDKIWSDTTESVKKSSEGVKTHFDGVTQEMLKMLKEFAAKSAELFASLPSTYDQYLAGLENGGKKAAAVLTETTAAINKGLSELPDLAGPAKVKMQAMIDSLTELRDRAKEFAADDSFAKIAQQVQLLTDKYQPQLAALSIETLDWVNSMNTAARDVPAALNKITDVELLTKFLESQKQIDDSTRKLANETTKWQEEYYKGTTQQIKITGDLDWTFGQFTDRVRTSGDIIRQQIGSINAVGVQTAQQMQAAMSAINQAVAAGAELYAKGTISLLQYDGLLQTQLQDQIKINQAIGASGTETLALTEKLAAVVQQEDILRDRTMALSLLYTNMLKVFQTAWDDLGKGIADAAVSGQNFGQALQNVLQKLETQIAELVTNWLLGKLKDALLQNGELLKGWNTLFNSIFGETGNVATGLKKTSEAFTATAETASKAGTDMSGSMAHAATSISQSAATMISGLNLVATAIGAIAGIFSAIELAHTNTLLGRIEESTRRMDIATEQQSDSVVATLHIIRDKITILTDWAWNQANTYLQQINEALDTLNATTAQVSTFLAQIAQGGGMAGTGSGAGSALGTTLGAAIAIPQGAALLAQAGQALSDAASATTDAAGATSDAAASTQAAADQALQNSRTQLQLATDATNNTTYAAAQINYGAQALVTASQDLSYEGLKAATVVQQVAQVVTQAAVVAAASTTLVSTFMQGVGGQSLANTPGGSFSFTPIVSPLPPAVVGPGVSGYNTGGMPFAAPQFPTGPVSVAINGSFIDSQQTVDRLVGAIVQRLQQKGLRMQQ